MAQDAYATIRREVKSAFTAAESHVFDVSTLRHVLALFPMFGSFAVQELARCLEAETAQLDDREQLLPSVKDVVELLSSQAWCFGPTRSTLISTLPQSSLLQQYVLGTGWQLKMVLGAKLLQSTLQVEQLARSLVISSMHGLQEFMLNLSADVDHVRVNDGNAYPCEGGRSAQIQLQDLQEAAGILLSHMERSQLGEHAELLLRSLHSRRLQSLKCEDNASALSTVQEGDGCTYERESFASQQQREAASTLTEGLIEAAKQSPFQDEWVEDEKKSEMSQRITSVLRRHLQRSDFEGPYLILALVGALDGLEPQSLRCQEAKPLLRRTLCAIISHAFVPVVEAPSSGSRALERRRLHNLPDLHILQHVGVLFPGGGVQALQSLFAASEHTEDDKLGHPQSGGWRVEDAADLIVEVASAAQEDAAPPAETEEADAAAQRLCEALERGDAEVRMGAEARARARVRLLVGLRTSRGSSSGARTQLWSAARGVERRVAREERMRALREVAAVVWRRCAWRVPAGRSMEERVEGELGLEHARELRGWMRASVAAAGRAEEEEGGAAGAAGTKELLVGILRAEEERGAWRDAAAVAVDVACWLDGSDAGSDAYLQGWVSALLDLRSQAVARLLPGRASREGLRVAGAMRAAVLEAAARGEGEGGQGHVREAVSALGKIKEDAEGRVEDEGGLERGGRGSSDAEAYAELRRRMREDADGVREGMATLSDEQRSSWAQFAARVLAGDANGAARGSADDGGWAEHVRLVTAWRAWRAPGHEAVASRLVPLPPALLAAISGEEGSAQGEAQSGEHLRVAVALARELRGCVDAKQLGAAVVEGVLRRPEGRQRLQGLLDRFGGYLYEGAVEEEARRRVEGGGWSAAAVEALGRLLGAWGRVRWERVWGRGEWEGAAPVLLEEMASRGGQGEAEGGAGGAGGGAAWRGAAALLCLRGASCAGDAMEGSRAWRLALGARVVYLAARSEREEGEARKWHALLRALWRGDDAEPGTAEAEAEGAGSEGAAVVVPRQLVRVLRLRRLQRSLDLAPVVPPFRRWLRWEAERAAAGRAAGGGAVEEERHVTEELHHVMVCGVFLPAQYPPRADSGGDGAWLADALQTLAVLPSPPPQTLLSLFHSLALSFAASPPSPRQLWLYDALSRLLSAPSPPPLSAVAAALAHVPPHSLFPASPDPSPAFEALCALLSLSPQLACTPVFACKLSWGLALCLSAPALSAPAAHVARQAVHEWVRAAGGPECAGAALERGDREGWMLRLRAEAGGHAARGLQDIRRQMQAAAEQAVEGGGGEERQAVAQAGASMQASSQRVGGPGHRSLREPEGRRGGEDPREPMLRAATRHGRRTAHAAAPAGAAPPAKAQGQAAAAGEADKEAKEAPGSAGRDYAPSTPPDAPATAASRLARAASGGEGGGGESSEEAAVPRGAGRRSRRGRGAEADALLEVKRRLPLQSAVGRPAEGKRQRSE